MKKYNGKKEIVGKSPYTKPGIYLKAQADELEVKFSFGEKEENLTQLGSTQSLEVISDDNKYNRFNGPGAGIYASGNGKKSANKAEYEWFEYREE